MTGEWHGCNVCPQFMHPHVGDDMSGTHHQAGDDPRMTMESSMSDHDAEAIAASLPVRDGDEPWTADEVREIIDALESDVHRMGTALAKAENDLADLMKQGNDGAGMDTIDVGSSKRSPLPATPVPSTTSRSSLSSCSTRAPGVPASPVARPLERLVCRPSREPPCASSASSAKSAGDLSH